jgi:hypothetical protein
MGLFINITNSFYNLTNCTGIPYLVQKIYTECFQEKDKCCYEYFERDVVYDTCYNGSIITCDISSKPIEIIDYMIQIFGITFIVIILTGCICFSGKIIFSDAKKKKNEYEELS